MQARSVVIRILYASIGMDFNMSLNQMTDSPISNLDAFDVVGVRKDGGLDLVISCSGALDSSPETIRSLEMKVRNYLHETFEAKGPSLLERYGCAFDSAISIIVSCPFRIDPVAMYAVERLKAEAGARGVALMLKAKT